VAVTLVNGDGMDPRGNFVSDIVALIREDIITKEEARALLIDQWPTLARAVALKAEAKSA